MRWGALQAAIALDASDRKSLNSWKVHRTCFQGLILLILDVLTLPFFVVLLLPGYRAAGPSAIWRGRGGAGLSNGDVECCTDASFLVPIYKGIDFHLSVAYNVFVVVHDLCVLAPLCLLATILGPHRLPSLSSISTVHFNRWWEYTEYSTSPVLAHY